VKLPRVATCKGGLAIAVEEAETGDENSISDVGVVARRDRKKMGGGRGKECGR